MIHRVAAIQMTSGPDVEANLTVAEKLIREASSQGAGLVVLPENFALMGKTEQDKLTISEREGCGVIQDFLSQQAVTHNIWIVGGTIPITATVTAGAVQKVRAACLVFDAQGNQAARYDKIHLFDVSLDENKEVYLESQTIEPGNSVVVCEAPCGRIGIAVCYVEIIVLPAAFTAITGKAHWEILVRARAIENLCYVIASAQGGYHANGRETYGDSMIVDPWGAVLKHLPQGPGVVVADVNRDRMTKLRRSFPAIEHRRFRTHIHTSKA